MGLSHPVSNPVNPWSTYEVKTVKPEREPLYAILFPAWWCEKKTSVCVLGRIRGGRQLVDGGLHSCEQQWFLHQMQVLPPFQLCCPHGSCSSGTKIHGPFLWIWVCPGTWEVIYSMSYKKTLKMWSQAEITYLRGSSRKYRQGTEEVKWEKGQKPRREYYQATVDNWSFCPSGGLWKSV